MNKEATEEEIRKAWEARLKRNNEARTVYINADTGRRMQAANSTSDIYKDVGKVTKEVGSNVRAAW